MSLPETIPFCPVHGEPWNDHEGACNQWLAAPDDSDCVVEWLRVAGRDDLLIRREDGAMTPERAATLRERMQMVADDAEADVVEFDGRPLTGKTVATMYGNTMAMIRALALTVQDVLAALAAADGEET